MRGYIARKHYKKLKPDMNKKKLVKSSVNHLSGISLNSTYVANFENDKTKATLSRLGSFKYDVK